MWFTWLALKLAGAIGKSLSAARATFGSLDQSKKVGTIESCMPLWFLAFNEDVR